MNPLVTTEPLPEVVLPACPIQKLLKGQKALVTGASSGIGKGIAIALGHAGADVVVNYRSGDDAAQAVADEDGRDSAIMILSPGDLFGAILPPEDSPPMGEFYRALSGVCLVRLGRGSFERLMQRFPNLACRIHKAYASRIHRLQLRVSDLLMHSVEERLALTLLELDRVAGKAGADGTHVLSLPLSHRDLAQFIGSSREMVTHVMARYRDEGLIGATRRREITLLDVEGLRRSCCASGRPHPF